jgi:DNA end-binding protein Ku
MARPIWTGSIAFGLVYVPVELYSATQEHRPQFHQLQKGSKHRIRYKRVDEKSGKQVEYDDIVKGFEVGKGRHVVLEDEELEAVAPTKTRTIDIEDFVELAEVDPIVWNKTYYVGPSGDAKADKPFVLLKRAMEATGKVAIGRFVMRSRQYLVTIRPFDDLLVLHTMYFADEVRDTDLVKHTPSSVHLSSKETDMARQLINSLSVKWKHEKYHDTYQERVMELIEKKKHGEEIVIEAPEKQGAEVIDIMDALKRSLTAPRPSKTSNGKARSRAKSGNGRAKGAVRKAANTNDLSELTKQELLERASGASIPGRTKMTRGQLIQALRKVS